MASNRSIVFVSILSLLLQASLSLPITEDEKTVQLTNSVPESGTTITLQEDNKLMQSLMMETLLKVFESESFEAVRGKRIKRHITKTQKLCPDDRIEYGGQCLTKEQYTEYIDTNGLEDSDDYDEER